MTRRVVGILGGMGPEATILLQQRLLATVRAADDADHLPLLIDMNPQVPSRIAHLIQGTGTDPGPTLAQMARGLEQAGATALGMPCNTAHHYAPAIEAAVSIPLLNMVSLSVARARALVAPGARVGLLASPAVRMAGVFDAALAEAQLTPLWPEDADRMLTAIRTIKAEGPVPAARAILTAAAEELADKGAALIFVACSEFSLIADSLPSSPPVIDTVDVLAEAIRDHTLAKP
ncbi:aspartate racemase (plasmid) [Ruegeria pomeroyi DSS-3]|uniref:Aspartate racemase n=2 Tax=Ruegeria pomeroyi TaxID=89184 RepID=Q5LLG5_RUEPO|nr:amino acid racemase [Ruegeria pomeroyi]AAV97202.1 aspartate racemase [Ruegeria pomeroyi DSS-3]NVK95598.1 amino acid racemase [Ruegeria pomeroyi]NVL00343.1 amino acid racemase [Ruegeria pomeroyi]